ncbi:hypothetical protein [Mucilaginibacter sp. PAMB04168]|uniref:hypothetical protein n=1 Tax=Mucilaginibacter sp. PAMB04168 TaxID=3138567 RepID=UPI0031F6A979
MEIFEKIIQAIFNDACTLYSAYRKGGWLIAMPLIIGFVLFVITDALSVNDKYNGAVTLLLSGIYCL